MNCLNDFLAVIVLTWPSMPQQSIHSLLQQVIKRQRDIYSNIVFLERNFPSVFIKCNILAKNLASNFWLLTFPTSTRFLCYSMHEWSKKKAHCRWTGNLQKEFHKRSWDLFRSAMLSQWHTLFLLSFDTISHYVWINTAAITPACYLKAVKNLSLTRQNFQNNSTSLKAPHLRQAVCRVT